MLWGDGTMQAGRRRGHCTLLDRRSWILVGIRVHDQCHVYSRVIRLQGVEFVAVIYRYEASSFIRSWTYFGVLTLGQ